MNTLHVLLITGGATLGVIVVILVIDYWRSERRP